MVIIGMYACIYTNQLNNVVYTEKVSPVYYWRFERNIGVAQRTGSGRVQE